MERTMVTAKIHRQIAKVYSPSCLNTYHAEIFHLTRQVNYWAVTVYFKVTIVGLQLYYFNKK